MRDELLKILQEHPDGLSSAELAVELAVHKRSVQRQLNKLLDSGEVEKTGKGRATIYRAINRAQDAQSYLKQPSSSRRYVGYNHEFLADYRPNTTFYLDEGHRKQLREWGQINPFEDPAGTYARKILDRLLIDLSWNSSRLEGNTYSLLETERLLLLGEPANDREAFETQMILNHKSAIEYMVDAADSITFDRRTILNLHALLSDFLLENPMDSGRLRKHSVAISGSTFIPLDNPYLLEEYFDEILGRAENIVDPFEQSFFALVHLPYLQPFADVNKRVARLAANIPFIKTNLSPLSFLDVQAQDYAHATLAVYELNDVSLLRDLYLDAYERSVQRYQAVASSVGPPNRLKLKYRDQIKDVARHIILNLLPQTAAKTWIEEFTKREIPTEDQSEFHSVTLQEVFSIHEGNFARFKVRPSQFEKWYKVWSVRTK